MLQVHPISAFTDNYIWAIRCPESPGCVAVVDPGDAAPVERYLSEKGMRLAAILLTHKHPDHVGGVETLLAAHEGVVGDAIELDGLGLRLSVIAVPGHTLEHIAYYGHGAVFCGDTLFSFGCGRLFEGEPAQMLASLDRIAGLPPETQVYCTHEYTEANLRFASRVLPEDEIIIDATERVAGLRRSGRPSLPVRLSEEMRGNPFLRVSEPAVRASCEQQTGESLPDRVAVFAALRAWKDRS
jgi:hydroxyacylglutathione hydrolase